eukprot:scaffold25196_cov211-Skeletonema_dohrnii-CCMP3373.AAC.3
MAISKLGQQCRGTGSTGMVSYYVPSFSIYARDHSCHVNSETSTLAPWGRCRSIIIIFVLEYLFNTY